MGAILHYLFSFEGRISRSGWWLAQIIMFLMAMLWVIHSFGPQVFGFGTFQSNTYTISSGENDVFRSGYDLNNEARTVDQPSTLPVESEQANEGMNKFWAGYLILAWFYCWVWLATTAKRLHDIGYSGWWGLPAFAPTLYHGVMFIASDRFTDFLPLLQYSSLSTLMQIMQSLAGLALMATCGGQKGLKTANIYGPPIGTAVEEPNRIRSFEREDNAIRLAVERMSALTSSAQSSTSNARLSVPTAFGKR